MIKDYTAKFTVIYIIATIFIGIICWLIFSKLNLQNSLEISIIVSLSLLCSLLTIWLHGKGLLPKPKDEIGDQDFSKKLKSYNYSRKRYQKELFIKKHYRNNDNTTFSITQLESNRFLPFNYQRKKFREHQ